MTSCKRGREMKDCGGSVCLAEGMVRTQINKIRNERGDVITDTREIQRFTKDC